MARVQTGRNHPRQAQEDPGPSKGLLRPTQEHDPNRSPGCREGGPICLSRPQGEEAELPRTVDPAHQRSGPCGGADLWSVHPRAEPCRDHARSQGARRYRDARSGGVQRHHHSGESSAREEGGLAFHFNLNQEGRCGTTAAPFPMARAALSRAIRDPNARDSRRYRRPIGKIP